MSDTKAKSASSVSAEMQAKIEEAKRVMTLKEGQSLEPQLIFEINPQYKGKKVFYDCSGIGAILPPLNLGDEPLTGTSAKTGEIKKVTIPVASQELIRKYYDKTPSWRGMFLVPDAYKGKAPWENVKAVN